MKIEIDDTVGRWVGSIVTVCSIVFAVFFFLDTRHVSHEEAMIADSKLRQRILMSDSTRYAEIAQYYQDVEKERELTKAEQARKTLVEEQQKRTIQTLLDSTNK